MGRSALHMKATVIRLPEAVRDKIDALVGKHRRAAFIREAIMRELSRRSRKGAES